MDTLYVGLCLLGFCVGGVFLGYGLARLDYIYVRLREWHEGASHLPQATGFFSQRMDKTARQNSAPQVVAEKIDIDTRTVVTQIDTAGIQKGSAVEFGHTTAKQDTLQESVSRLAQLKAK